MKKFSTIIIYFILTSYSFAESKIVYLDVQYIIDNSNIGIFYKKKVKSIQAENKKQISLKENEIKEKEIEINNQKNILKKDEIENKVKKLNILLKQYQNERNRQNKQIIEEKKKYTSKILNILNPLLTNYVKDNKIILVIEKKNILIGVKTLDITKDVLKILNDKTSEESLLKNDQ